MHLFSKYRTELMGFATICILICHAPANGVTFHPAILKAMGAMQMGVQLFMFLSGIGLYFSLSREGDELKISRWYKKRLLRLMVPYWLICGPISLYAFYRGDITLWQLFLCLTTVGNWIGSLYVAWFVAALIPLYLITPFIVNKILGSRRQHLVFVFLFLVTFLIQVLLCRYGSQDSVYVCKLFQFVYSVPSFLLGVYCAPLVKRGATLTVGQIVLVLVAVVALWCMLYWLTATKQYWMFMILFAGGLCVILQNVLISKTLSFVGVISLESYLLNTNLPGLLSLRGNWGYLMVVVLCILLGWLLHCISNYILHPKSIRNL